MLLLSCVNYLKTLECRMILKDVNTAFWNIDSTPVPIDTIHTFLIQSFYIEVLEDNFSQVFTSKETELTKFAK